ncbi:MMPL family transporter [Streptomyces sp. NPDC056470]|uniref:MMPL family transporter n=1 Tax=Streptomyces sp. NPDC056470 TaxID=3345831 RepID=UPI0036BB88DB
MSTYLGRLGGAAAARPWRVIVGWLLLIAVALGLSAAFGGTPRDDYRVPGTRSTAGRDLLVERFPEMSGASARVVVHNRGGQPVPTAALEDLQHRLAGLRGVSRVEKPLLSADAATALLNVTYRIPVTDFKGSESVDDLSEAARPTRDSGLQVEFGGQLPENFSAPDGTPELIGAAAALVILVFALGTLVSAGLPLVVALVGLTLGSALTGLLAAITDISPTAPTVATMVGLGVGIDYALLLLSRHIEATRRGLTGEQAAFEAGSTAGSSVVIAGSTVLVSLLGLKLAGLPVFASFGYATFAVVSAVMLAALTLVPALCGLAGPRLIRRAQRLIPATKASGGRTGTRRWAELVGRRPLAAAFASMAVLLALAAPVLGMRMWPKDAGSQPVSHTTRQAYDLIANAYGPGANGPLVVAVDLTKVPVDRLPAISRRLAAAPGVAGVTPALVNPAGDAAVLSVQPETEPQDQATVQLLERVRDEVLPAGAEVTGVVAVYADVSKRLADRLWVVVPFVVALSLVLLTVLLRAPVVALKAAAMNLLSVAAAYGVMTAVFQSDAGARALGLPHAVPVSSYVPILMFTVLFGLSMDYEVFLLGRIREDWLATRDARGSVVRGLSATGRVISSAAAIMIAVFTGFAMDPDVTVKMMGVGMAAAVLIDATLVRLVLVPATMTLLGRFNWWIPGWLDRLLPKIKTEGGVPVTTTGRVPAPRQ